MKNFVWAVVARTSYDSRTRMYSDKEPIIVSYDMEHSFHSEVHEGETIQTPCTDYKFYFEHSGGAFPGENLAIFPSKEQAESFTQLIHRHGHLLELNEVKILLEYKYYNK